MGIPSASHRARYGSVGMSLRAGRLTRSNTGGGGPNQYGTETAYSTSRESQDCVCVCVCEHKTLGYLSSPLVQLNCTHPWTCSGLTYTQTQTHYSSSCRSLFRSQGYLYFISVGVFGAVCALMWRREIWTSCGSALGAWLALRLVMCVLVCE